MPFFQHLKEKEVSTDQLAKIHHLYQSAMHATRAGVYLMPHLNSPALRKHKLKIFVDDDGLSNGDTHHYQLTRAFRHMGVIPFFDDEVFGDQDDCAGMLAPWPRTRSFVRKAFSLYTRSLGPWCVIEGLSSDWMRALAESLKPHCPTIIQQPYFEECFSEQVEERHAEEALLVTNTVLNHRPALLPYTLRTARQIAHLLDGVWHDLDDVVVGSK
jgi:hypothetical protein